MEQFSDETIGVVPNGREMKFGWFLVIFTVFTLGCKSNKESPDETFGVKDSPNVNINLLSISPNQKNVVLGESYQFKATGGTSPFVFSLESGVGSVTSKGFYSAPNFQGTAVLKVTDAENKEAYAAIQVVEKLTVNPGSKIIGTNQTATFLVAGGLSPYTFNVISGAGSITLSTGVYTAPNYKTNAIIEIVDSLGATTYATVVVSNDLVIAPSTKVLGYGEVFTFTASGGALPYSYSLVGSQGSVSSSGVYTAPNSDAAVEVRVTDGNGNTSTASVSIVDKPIFSEKTITLPLSGTYIPSVTGGTPPYSYALTGGGTILNASTGEIQAPNIVQTSSLRVTDANGMTDDLLFTTFQTPILATGLQHTCVLVFDNSGNSKMKCFGTDLYTYHGRGIIGDEPNEMGDNLGAVNTGEHLNIDTSNPSSIIGIKTSKANTCIIYDDYLIKCWGDQTYGAIGWQAPQNHMGLGRGTMGSVLRTIDFGTNRRIKSSIAINASVDIENYGGCAILDNDTVKCWGFGSYGGNGVGNTGHYGDYNLEMGDNWPAVNLNAGAAVPIQVSRGYEFSCALVSDGRVKCWGRNHVGQLGIGDTTDRATAPGNTPNTYAFIDLGTGLTATYIASGAYHSCAILNDNTVKCWGYNAQGQLGVGDTANRGDNPGEMGDALPIAELGTGKIPVKLALGDYFSCALFNDGDVKCWGENQYGQLGQGNTSYRGGGPAQMGDNLLAINWGSGAEAIDMDSSAYGVCALLDIDNDTIGDQMKCVGRNELGQLGQEHKFHIGKSLFSLGDNLDPINLGTGLKPVAIATGLHNSCALLDNGSVKCFGMNHTGVLGSENYLTGDFPGEVANAPFLELDEGIKSVKSSYTMSCLLTGNNELKCWGENGYGSVGIGNISRHGERAIDFLPENFESVRLGAGVTVKDFGVFHAGVCAILNDNSMKCWGYNGYGQLGYENTTPYGHNLGSLPESRPAVNLGTGLYATKVVGGMYNVCAILNNGKLKCWGDNQYGQLGIGTTQRMGDQAGEMGDSLPHVLFDNADVRTVADVCVGQHHACALLDNAQVKCWGHFERLGIGYDAANPAIGDQAGEMGDNLPYVNLGTGRTVKKLGCGMHHNCAILDNNELKCWGPGSAARLGYGNLNSHYLLNEMGDNLPAVNLGTGKFAVDINGGNEHTCVVLNDSSIKCWGANNYSQLGAGHLFMLGDSGMSVGDNLPAVDLGVDP